MFIMNTFLTVILQASSLHWNFWLLANTSFFNNLFYVCWYFPFIHVRVKVSDTLQLELQTVVKAAMHMLGIEPWSPGGTARALTTELLLQPPNISKAFTQAFDK